MAIHYRTQGFILKKVDRGEADQIFTIYTKDFGKLEILGKAIRKIKSKLRGGMETFYLSEIEFIQGKTYKTLTDAILIESFPGLRKDLKRLGAAYKIAEIADNLIKGEEKDEDIWELISEIFDKLNSPQPLAITHQLLYYYFLWNLLAISGYQPELYTCNLCQKKLAPKDLYFNSKEGGVICGQCRKSTKSAKKIEPDTVKILRILLKKRLQPTHRVLPPSAGPWPTLNRLKIEATNLKSLKIISDYYLSEVLEQGE